MSDAIATLIDTTAKPLTADDDRSAGQRQAEALADACGYVLDHGSSIEVPASGGRRPHLNIIVQLDDLERRARAAMLDFGGTLSPESLRMLCCDAAVIPIVMDGRGSPLDIGRHSRTIPEGVRRAVAARDQGCARCGRPASWCEIHHIIEWPIGGPTCVNDSVMVCKACHRLIHHAGWTSASSTDCPSSIPRRGSTCYADPADDHHHPSRCAQPDPQRRLEPIRRQVASRAAPRVGDDSLMRTSGTGGRHAS